MRCLIVSLLLSVFLVLPVQAEQQVDSLSDSSALITQADQLTEAETQPEQLPLKPSEQTTHSQQNLTQKSKGSYEPMNSWPVVLGTLFGMVGCILALAWFARRFNGLNIARNKDMEIISTLSVGTREKITLVKVQGQTLLLGVTSQNISRLHAFDPEEALADSSNNLDEPNIIKSDFSATLKGLLSKTNSQKGSGKASSISNEGEAQ